MRELTPIEMIIEVEQQLQRQASHKRDGLTRDHILWRLNTAQDRFIKYRIKPDKTGLRFEIDKKSQADLQSLLITNYSLRAILDPKDASRVYSELPSNLAYVVADGSTVVEDSEEIYTSLVEPFTETAVRLPLIDSPLTQPNYYKSFILLLGFSEVSKLTSEGVISKNQKFEFINPLMENWRRAGYQVYWERYKHLYAPGNFYVVVESGLLPNLTVDGSLASGGSIAITGERHKRISGKPIVPNDLVKSDYIREAVRGTNYYLQPIPTAPVSSISDNKIYVYNGKRFLISEILIDYIRKPRQISLLLNRSCELPGSTHEEICSIATEMILGNVESENYQQKVQENVYRLE